MNTYAQHILTLEGKGVLGFCVETSHTKGHAVHWNYDVILADSVFDLVFDYEVLTNPESKAEDKENSQEFMVDTVKKLSQHYGNYFTVMVEVEDKLYEVFVSYMPENGEWVVISEYEKYTPTEEQLQYIAAVSVSEEGVSTEGTFLLRSTERMCVALAAIKKGVSVSFVEDPRYSSVLEVYGSYNLLGAKK